MKLVIYGGSDTERRQHLKELAEKHSMTIVDDDNFIRTDSLVGNNLLIITADRVTVDKFTKFTGNVAILANSLNEVDWKIAKTLQKVRVGDDSTSTLFKFLDKLLTETDYQNLLEESEQYPFGKILRWLLRLTFKLDSDEVFGILESVDRLEYKVDDKMLRSALVLLFPKRYQKFKAKWQLVEPDLVARGIIEKIRYTFRDARRLAPQIFRLIKVLAVSEHGYDLIKILNLTEDEVSYLNISKKKPEVKTIPRMELTEFF